MKATSLRIANWFMFFSCLVVLSTLASTTAVAAGPEVTVAPASRAENITSPEGDLGNQEIQEVGFEEPIITSLVTVANLGMTGHRSFLVVFLVSGGGRFSFSVKEDLDDVTLPLAQPIPVTGVWIRCDSGGSARCRYSVNLVGN